MNNRKINSIKLIQNTIDNYKSQNIYDYLTYPHFESPEYFWDLDPESETWKNVTEYSGDVENLVPDNLFEKSDIRKSGLKIWDAVVGYGRRPGDFIKIRDVPAIQNINFQWSNDIVTCLDKVRRGEDGLITRPKGNFIFDLVSFNHGWKILELSHALAHIAGDPENVAKKHNKYSIGMMSNTFMEYVFKVCASIKFHIPIDVMMCGYDKNTNDGFDKYGIKTCVSSKIRNPIALVDAIGKDSPEPDKTVAILCGGIRIEPQPHGATDEGNGKWLELNRWSCEPTVVAFAGWVPVDVLERSPFVPYKKSAYYAVRPQAFEPIKTFNEIIEQAKNTVGEAVPDNNRYWMVEDLIDPKNDDKFYKLISHSPPLPCMECSKLNAMTEGAPERPSISPDDFGGEEEWDKWFGRIMKYIDMAEKATIYHEYRVYGSTAARRFRKGRIEFCKNKNKVLRQLARLNDRMRRASIKGDPDKIMKLDDMIYLKIEELNNLMNNY